MDEEILVRREQRMENRKQRTGTALKTALRSPISNFQSLPKELP
jgi:hypothetical protein